METNANIKSIAKQKFKSNYWTTVGVCVVASIVLMITVEYTAFTNALQEMMHTEPGTISTNLSTFSFFYTIFIGNILTVGLSSFLIKNGSRAGQPEFMELFSGFKENYGNTLVTMGLRYLFIFLWALLFVIPGIIKALEYSMIPYLLADYPGLSRQEAFARSRQLMNGKKMQLFCLHLSFIGWYFLGAITFGIVNVLYTEPYVSQAEAQFYLEAKEDLYRQMQNG